VSNEVEKITVKHHERLDGSGYNEVLLGDDRTFNKRLVATSDVYSALITNRSYKAAYSKAKTSLITKDQVQADKLDKDITNACLSIHEENVHGVGIVSTLMFEAYQRISDEYSLLLGAYSKHQSKQYSLAFCSG
jgi:HD-GYP domain-containing protein (c-di-GMP phosphodiesterase class II)